MNELWAAGPAANPAVGELGRTLATALRTGEDGGVPAGLVELVTGVRQVATVDFPFVVTEDGIRLSAMTIAWNDGQPRPVVVVPAGWSPFGWLPFVYGYLTLACRGYHVLAYTPRGVGHPAMSATSTGTIDVAGPKDWADGSRMIDYAQEQFTPSRVGLLGLSYGAGISQLVAAHDPGARVAAVVALSAWGNLTANRYGHRVRRVAAVAALIGNTGGALEEKFDPDTRRALTELAAGRNSDHVVAWGTERALDSYVDNINRRGTPMFLSHTWHESLFPVNQVLATFARLTVPKRLNLWMGDHAAPEVSGLTGLARGLPFPGQQVPVAEAHDWLDHHLLGVENDVPAWTEVSSQVMFTYRTVALPGGTNLIVAPARREPAATWAEVTTSRERWYLTGGREPGDATLAASASHGWERAFLAGELTEATAVNAIRQTGLAEWFGNPKRYDLGTFDRSRMLLWSTGPLSGQHGVARRVRGAATVRLTVRSTADAATLVAYLFDVAPDGTARIITHEPCTVVDLTPNQDRAVEWQLQAAAYDLPVDHQLTLVINSRDQLYSFAGTPGSTTTISSPTGQESTLDLPLG